MFFFVSENFAQIYICMIIFIAELTFPCMKLQFSQSSIETILGCFTYSLMYQ